MKNQEVRQFLGLRAVYYARVSTEEERQVNALEKQVDECKETINEKGWVLVDGYVDEGKSGTQIRRRNEYQRLMADLEEDKFDVIVVKSQDRLQRNTKDWYCFVDRLVQNGKKLYLYLEGKFFTPADDALITGIKAILAEEYSRDLSKKLNNAAQRRIEKVRNGEKVTAMGTNLCYGYYIKDGEWCVDHEQAKITKMVYELYLKYDSVRKVVEYLNENGYRNQKGGLFCSDSIARMLKNPRYKGTLVVNRYHRNFETKRVDEYPPEEWVIQDNAFEAIIDADTWQKVNDRISVKKGNKRGRKVSRDPLGGKVFCAECGSRMWKHTSHDYPGWYCSKKMSRGKMACVGTYVSSNRINNILRALTRDLRVNKDAVRKSMLAWLESLRSSLSAGEDVSEIEHELDRLKGKKEKLLDAFLEGIIQKADYKRKCAELEAVEANLKKRIEPIEENEDIKDVERIIADIDNELDRWMETEDFIEHKVEFITEHITKITLNKDKVLVIELDLVGGAIVAGKNFLLFVRERVSVNFSRKRIYLQGKRIRVGRSVCNRQFCDQYGGDRKSSAQGDSEQTQRGGNPFSAT